MRQDFRHPHTLMVQGTTSDAGKSILVTALCRILARQGVKVAPFKPQNMALNSAVTADGGEIGRAQAVQAEACYLAPTVYMNPILLKPNTDIGAQVIVYGKSIGNMDAQTYHAHKPKLLKEVIAAHEQLRELYDVVIVEGAGSPAEINLRENDLANMGFAEAVDCPVIIVADIDRGGVFAHLVGTYELLSESERERVVGFVINRFRGDISLLTSGLEWLEQRTHVPVLGVIPYIHNLHIEAEDAVNVEQQTQGQLKVVVVGYPRMSNHTDVDTLRIHPQVDCQFLRDANAFKGADLILLPGSKNVRGDRQWLAANGWEAVILRHLRFGGKVLGICGGYQMLGDWLHDPEGIESAPGSSSGLGLLSMETTLTAYKKLKNVSGQTLESAVLPGELTVTGYEIHAGISQGPCLQNPLFNLTHDVNQPAFFEGSYSEDGAIIGTYLHGVFDQPEICSALLTWAGLPEVETFDYSAFRQHHINRLADEVEFAMPLSVVRALTGLIR